MSWHPWRCGTGLTSLGVPRARAPWPSGRGRARAEEEPPLFPLSSLMFFVLPHCHSQNMPARRSSALTIAAALLGLGGRANGEGGERKEGVHSSIPSPPLLSIFPLRPGEMRTHSLTHTPSLSLLHPADCASEITAISHGACLGVRGPLFGAASTVSAYAGGGVACPALQADAAALVPASILTDDCCTSLRSFVAAGCACDGDVLALLEGIQVLPAGADPAATVGGVVALIQGSRCSGAALGGPLLDACTGGTGCPIVGGSSGVVA